METKDKNQKSEISSDKPASKRDWLKWAAQKGEDRSSADYEKIKKDAYKRLNSLYKELELATSDKEREKIKNKINTTKLHIVYTKRNLKKAIRKEDELTSDLMPALAIARKTKVGTEVIEENCKITNNSNIDLSQLENIVSRFYPYVKEKLNFNHDAEVNLVSDPENSKDPWGKTAYYDPATMKITIFVDGRHPKDMLRSLSHELVHHAQNCRGEFDKTQTLEPGYAQKDPHMRRMEGEAYLLGNGFLVRDFEDLLKCQKHQSLTESKKMKNLTKEQIETLVSRAVKIVEETISEQSAAEQALLNNTSTELKNIQDFVSKASAGDSGTKSKSKRAAAKKIAPKTTPTPQAQTKSNFKPDYDYIGGDDFDDFMANVYGPPSSPKSPPVKKVEPKIASTPTTSADLEAMKLAWSEDQANLLAGIGAKVVQPPEERPSPKPTTTTDVSSTQPKRQGSPGGEPGYQFDRPFIKAFKKSFRGKGLEEKKERSKANSTIAIAQSATDKVTNLPPAVEDALAPLASARGLARQARWGAEPINYNQAAQTKTQKKSSAPIQTAQLEEQPTAAEKDEMSSVIRKGADALAAADKRKETPYDVAVDRMVSRSTPTGNKKDIEADIAADAAAAGFSGKYNVDNKKYVRAKLTKKPPTKKLKETNPMKALTNEQLKTVLENTIKRMLKEVKTPISETYEDMYPAKRDEDITEEKGNICDKLAAALETADSDVLKAKIGMKMADEGCPGSGLAVEENIIKEFDEEEMYGMHKRDCSKLGNLQAIKDCMDAAGMGPADDVKIMQLIDKELGVKHSNPYERAAALEDEIAKEEAKIDKGEADADPKRLGRLEYLQGKHDDYMAAAHMDLEESLTSKKDRLLFERLTKKWTK